MCCVSGKHIQTQSSAASPPHSESSKETFAFFIVVFETQMSTHLLLVADQRLYALNE